MLFTILGFALLFFIPIVESFNRFAGMSLLVAGSSILFLSILFQKHIHLDRFDALFLLLLGIFAITSFFSWAPLRSYTEFVRYISYFFVFASIRRIDNKLKFLTHFFLPMIFVNSIILGILYIISTVSFLKLIPPPVLSMNLFYPTWGHNRLAEFILFAIPFPIVYLSHIKSRIMQLLVFEFSFLLLLIMLASSARGALLSLAFSFLVVSFLHKNASKTFLWVTLFVTGATLLLLISSFIYSNYFISSKIPTETIAVLYKPVGREQRFDYLKQALLGFFGYPLLGTGLDTFRYVSMKYKGPSASLSFYTHNQFLEMFTETGIFGGLVFIGFILVLFKHALDRGTDRIFHHPFFWACIISLFASSLHNLLDYDWHFLSLYLLYWVLFACLIPIKPHTHSKNHIFTIYSLTTILIAIMLPLLFFTLDEDILLEKGNQLVKERNYFEAIPKFLFIARHDDSNIDAAGILSILYAKINNAPNALFWQNDSIRRQKQYQPFVLSIDN